MMSIDRDHETIASRSVSRYAAISLQYPCVAVSIVYSFFGASAFAYVRCAFSYAMIVSFRE